jgi:SPX domain protein involved in polyphosphate accumulation
MKKEKEKEQRKERKREEKFTVTPYCGFAAIVRQQDDKQQYSVISSERASRLGRKPFFQPLLPQDGCLFWKRGQKRLEGKL